MPPQNIGFTGSPSYLVMEPELSWTVPVSGSTGLGTGSGFVPVYFLPVDDYKVMYTPDVRQARPFTGVFTQRHSQKYRGMPRGSIVTALYGAKVAGTSLMQVILDWALAPGSSYFLPSYQTMWAEGPGIADKQHNGLRVNTFAVSGSEDNPILTCNIDAMGQSESENPVIPALPDNWNKLNQAEFVDVAITMDASPFNFGGFTLTQNNQLLAKYLGSRSVTTMPRVRREITLAIRPPKVDTTWDEELRTLAQTEHAFTLTLKALHNGTGAPGTNYSQALITLPRCKIETGPTDLKQEDLTYQDLLVRALKPDNATDVLTVAYSDV